MTGSRFSIVLVLNYAKCIILLPYLTQCFNIAPEAVHIFSYKGHSEKTTAGRAAYFGYSVGLLQNQDDNSFWVVAGAPRHNTSSPPNRRPGYINPTEAGGLFKCKVEIGERDTCAEVVLDIDDNFNLNEIKPLRDNAWTGASLDVSSKGNVVTCAPSWKNANDTGIYRLNGICYEVDYRLLDNEAVRLKPLSSATRQLITTYGQTFYFYSSGQAGMSVQYNGNDDPVIGAPGVYNWFGSIALITRQVNNFFGERNKRSVKNASTVSGRRQKRQLPKGQIIHNVPLPTATRGGRQFIDDADYFGYSVTSGKFYKGNQTIYYAAGAPRGGDSRGNVLIFQIHEYDNQIMRVTSTATGTQLGEYFGAAIYSADFDGDGASDMAVGAPMHSIDNYPDMGLVYVYQSKDAERETALVSSVSLSGDRVQGGRFGTALGAADLDQNDCDDLLVGSPYEDEFSGAVYVFMGSKRGISIKYSQKLTPEKVTQKIPLRGFGISFSRSHDVDSNGFPDFAVGSFLSDDVALMLTRPVVAMSAQLYASPSKLSHRDTEFLIKVCLKITSKIKQPRLRYDTIARVVMTQESSTGLIGAIFRDEGSTSTNITLPVQGQDLACKNISVDIKQEDSDAQSPIMITMEYDLQSNLVTPDSPVLNDLTTTAVTAIVSFVTGCENKDGDKRCLSDLEAVAEFHDVDMGDTILIGSRKVVEVSIEVTNYGEPAFLPVVNVSVAKPLNFNPTERDCSKIITQLRVILVCKLKNPIVKDETDTIHLELDVSELSDSSTELDLYITADSAADLDTDITNNYIHRSLKLTREAELKTSGWSTPEQFVYQRFSEHEMNTTGTINVTHVHQVSKTGITPVDNVELILQIPSFVVRPSGEILPLAFLRFHEIKFQGDSLVCKVNSNIQYNTSKQQNVILPSLSASARQLPIGSARLSFLNCSSQLLECTTITCSIGPWKQNFEAANLKVELEINQTTLSQIITIDHGAYFQTESHARIASLPYFDEFKGIREARNSVHSFLMPGSLSEAAALSWWIILLAVLGGILLLSLIVAGLYKGGFFKRKQRDDMLAGKATLVKSQDEKQ